MSLFEHSLNAIYSIYAIPCASKLRHAVISVCFACRIFKALHIHNLSYSPHLIQDILRTTISAQHQSQKTKVHPGTFYGTRTLKNKYFLFYINTVHVLDKLKHLAGISVFVIIECNKLEKLVVYGNTLSRIKNRCV